MNANSGLSQGRHQLLGVVYLLVVAAFLTLTVAIYRKAFTPVVHVRLQVDHVGNQLQPGSDVKVRGLVVGEVRTVRSTGEHAELGLALDPDRVSLIPDNVTARLLPKTLFGERFVALQIPADRSHVAMADGAVIGQDRSSAAIEVEQVLSNLIPVLQAVQPHELSTALTAISTALDGRGAQLGQTLVRLDAYLSELEPSLPDLAADIKSLATVADTYAEAAPDLLDALADLTETSRTVVELRSDLDLMFGTLTTAAVDVTRFLAVNKDNIIGLAATSRPTLDVLAKYAPEYPCFIKQFADAVPVTDEALGKGSAHPNRAKFTVEVVVGRGKYVPGKDAPRNLDTRGPRCYDQPLPPTNAPQYPTEGPLRDGATKPAPAREGGLVSGLTAPQAAGAVPDVANTPAERDLLSVLLAPSLGVLPDDVPAWSSLLVGPLYRGAEVTVR